MNHTLTVQYALACLQALDLENPKPLTACEIGHQQGIPIDICKNVLESLANACILETDESERYHLRRPVEALTSLEVLQAVWNPVPKVTHFRMLFTKCRDALHRTRQAVSVAQGLNAFPGEDGR